MADSDDTLIDKIRDAMLYIREHSDPPEYILAPHGWLDVKDVDGLIAPAAARFGVAEDDVTYEMIFAVHADRIAKSDH